MCALSLVVPSHSSGSSPPSGLAKLVFVTYNNLERLLKADINAKTVVRAENEDEDLQGDEPYAAGSGARKEEEEEERVINTNVISASINRRKTATKLAEPILYTLEHKTVSEQEQLSQSTAVSVKYVVYWVAVGTTFISNY